jgi:hypothetical protein
MAFIVLGRWMFQIWVQHKKTKKKALSGCDMMFMTASGSALKKIKIT